ncbi:MAG: circularly permuted type 2 ATP-grasp protein, partial [Geminicoccaceae bacterium]|nr:circularly permuted type 2 ATP-grasp protein [Geminicoccaceae bacterium]
PEMVRFYLGEAPLLKNVPTWRCSEAESLAYVREHLDELVVKAVHGSGGYGMLVGPHASKEELEQFRLKLEADPSGYIAQPTLSLSTCPAFVNRGIA